MSQVLKIRKNTTGKLARKLSLKNCKKLLLEKNSQRSDLLITKKCFGVTSTFIFSRCNFLIQRYESLILSNLPMHSPTYFMIFLHIIFPGFVHAKSLKYVSSLEIKRMGFASEKHFGLKKRQQCEVWMMFRGKSWGDFATEIFSQRLHQNGCGVDP